MMFIINYNLLKSSNLWKNVTRYFTSFPELNIDFIGNPKHIQRISENIERRKGVGNIKLVQELYNKLQNTNRTSEEYKTIQKQFYDEAARLPNDTHPDVLNYGTEPRLVKYLGKKPDYNIKPNEFHILTKKLNLMRTEHLGNVAANRSYYFMGALAEIEQALVRLTINKLLKSGFQLISVPDILQSSTIESCGMSTREERTQVYFLNEKHGSDLCLSGTAEMAIAGYFKNKTISFKELPLKIASVSRCYRAETSSIAEERGIYRVHQFTKVEMFALTRPEDSSGMLEYFRNFQEEHFSSFGFHLQTLDMPACELGSPAFRKYDVEAWLPGRGMFGELSSCSNCTDYQSRRLAIKYVNENNEMDFVHTVNGTACAIPRMLIALLEYNQGADGNINVPASLRPFLKFNQIRKQSDIPELKLKKLKR